MTRIGHIFRELTRNMYRNAGTVLGSFLSLTLIFLLFDLFWIGAGTTERFYNHLVSELQMEVFVDEAVEETSVREIADTLKNIEGILSATYVSKEQAREKLRTLVGTDLLVGYDSTNPLPRSFVLQIDPAYLNTVDMTRLENDLVYTDGISDVYFSRRWLSKAERTRNIIFSLGMALGALILLVAIINTTNNIRLMTRTRAVGFRQMRLLGAGRLFLAVPFLLEGLIIGGLSAVVGWVAILYAAPQVTFTQFELVFPPRADIVYFCAVTALIGLFSGYLGIRKMLK